MVYTVYRLIFLVRLHLHYSGLSAMILLNVRLSVEVLMFETWFQGLALGLETQCRGLDLVLVWFGLEIKKLRSWS